MNILSSNVLLASSNMDYVRSILFIIAGIGALIIASRLLSGSIEKLANSRLKAIFKKTSNNKIIGVGIGLGATALVQNSTATTVMVVGFVNTGLMSLLQATCVIMGANIGTTIVGLIAALGDVDFSIYLIALTAIGVFITMFAKKDKIKTMGMAIAALGLFFTALKIMSQSIKDINSEGVISNFLSKVSTAPAAPLLLLLIGFAITALIQSSGAVTGILISMAAAGVVFGGGPNSALFLILGTNMGTTVTAMISSIGTNTNAKRAALIHFMFNLFGTIIWFLILTLWNNFMKDALGWLPSTAWRLAIFHTLFNTVCTLIFLPFADILFVRLSKLIIRDKKDEEKGLTYMDERFVSSPPIALEQLGRETVRMIDIAMENLQVAFNGFIEMDDSRSHEVIETTDRVANINKEIIAYLVKVAANDVSLSDEQYISSLHHVVGDALRVSELSNNVARYTEKSIGEELEFTDEVKAELKNMFDKIKEAYADIRVAFSNREKDLLPQIDEKEEEINRLRKEMVDNHIRRLNDGECHPQNSGVFINLVNNLERVADHLNHIAHSVE